MAELKSNIRHFLETGTSRCLLCKQPVGNDFSLHYCPVETRIREIVREEMRAEGKSDGR